MDITRILYPLWILADIVQLICLLGSIVMCIWSPEYWVAYLLLAAVLIRATELLRDAYKPHAPYWTLGK